MIFLVKEHAGNTFYIQHNTVRKDTERKQNKKIRYKKFVFKLQRQTKKRESGTAVFL